MERTAIVALNDPRTHDVIFKHDECHETMKGRIIQLPELRQDASTGQQALQSHRGHGSNCSALFTNGKMTTLRARTKQIQLESLKQSTLSVLREELDQRTMESAIDAIKSLNSIDFSKLPSFERARDAAVLDVTNMLAGVDDRGFKEKLISLFNSNDNPIYTALAFGSAIKSFFPVLAKYIDAIAVKNQQTAEASTRIEDIGTLDLNKALRTLIERNFKPKGLVFKAHGKGWYGKYFGRQSSSALVDDIMFLTLDELKQVVTDVRRTGQAATAPAEIAKNQTTTEPIEDDDKDHEQRIKAAWKKISTDMGDLSSDEKRLVSRTLSALKKQGLLTQ